MKLREALLRELKARDLVGVYMAAADESEDAAIDVQGTPYSFQLLTFGGGFALNHYEGEGASFVLTDLGTYDETASGVRIAVGRLIRHKETGK